VVSYYQIAWSDDMYKPCILLINLIQWAIDWFSKLEIRILELSITCALVEKSSCTLLIFSLCSKQVLIIFGCTLSRVPLKLLNHAFVPK
jgi:hypothetical protein